MLQPPRNAHALGEPLLADPHEIPRRPLKPGGGHPAFLVPDGGKTLPIAGIAPHRPVLDEVADGEAIEELLVHEHVSDGTAAATAAARGMSGEFDGRQA
jgi:hypothetical protein